MSTLPMVDIAKTLIIIYVGLIIFHVLGWIFLHAMTQQSLYFQSNICYHRHFQWLPVYYKCIEILAILHFG